MEDRIRRTMAGTKLCALSLLLLINIARVNGGGCPIPLPIAKGSFTPVKSSYSIDELVEYSCELGYRLKDGHAIRVCQGYPVVSVWFWTGEQPLCEAIDCGRLNIPFADYTEPESTIYSSTVQYRCRESPAVTRVAFCNQTAEWEYTQCQTQPVTCSAPPMIPHSTVNTTATSHHVGAAVQYQCIPGYPERSGTLACVEGDNGEGYWVGETISCTKPRVTSTEAQTAITSLELPITAGVLTAVILTVLLIVGVYCVRRRRLERRNSIQKTDSQQPPVDDSFKFTTNQSFQTDQSESMSRSGTPTPSRTLPASIRIQNEKCSSTLPQFPAGEEQLYPERPFTPCRMDGKQLATLPPLHINPHLMGVSHQGSPHSSVSSSQNSSTISPSHNLLPGEKTTDSRPPVPTLPPYSEHYHRRNPFVDFVDMGHLHCPRHTCADNNNFNTKEPGFRVAPYQSPIVDPQTCDHIYQPLENVYEEPWAVRTQFPQHTCDRHNFV